MERTTAGSDSKRRRSDRQREQDGSSSGGAGRVAVAALHGAAGNQAVRELHERGELQAKLAVSQPADPAEREAERVADEVVTGPAPSVAADAEIRRSGTADGQTVDGETERRVRSSLSGGRPLPGSTRSFFEERFGGDFSDVRVHTGPEADAAARSIDAEAFTVGTDIAFASGNYRPSTAAGTELLAHELTHVVQQGTDRTGAHRQETGGDSGEYDLPATLPMRSDVTGTFGEVGGDSHGQARSTLSLNQAGGVVVGRYAWRVKKGRHEHADMDPREHSQDVRTARISGRTSGQGEFACRLESSDLSVDSATLEVRDGGDCLVLETDRWTERFERMTSATDAMLSSAALSQADGPDQSLLGVRERTPLAPRDKETIDDLTDEVVRNIEEFLEAETDSERRARVDDISEEIVETLKPWAGTQRSNEQWPLVRFHLYNSLENTVVQQGEETFSAWVWMRRIFTRYPQHGTVTEAESVLGMDVTDVGTEETGDIHGETPGFPEDPTPYKYRWKYTQARLSGTLVISGAVGIGWLTIEKLGTDESSREWEKTYGLTVVKGESPSGGIGGDAGKSTDWQEFYTQREWTQENFEGGYSITSAQAGFTAEGGSGSASAKVEDKTGIVFTDPALGACAAPIGDKTLFGGEVSTAAKVSQEFGYLFDPDYLLGGEDGGEVGTAEYDPQPITSKGEVGAVGVTVFPVDRSEITSAGREAIQRFCARYRAALTNDNTTVTLHGHASTTASDQYNMDLSEDRARNVKQAIIEALYPRTGGEDAEGIGATIEPEAFGEHIARMHTEDETERWWWRRVDVFIDGSYVQSFQAGTGG